MHGRETAGRFARATAWTAVKLRWPLLIGWTVAAIAASLLLPGLGTGGQSSPLGDILPASSEALRTEQRALELFGSSVATDTVVVQRTPRGLSRAEIEAHVAGARGVAGDQSPAGLGGIRAAVPLVNAPLGGLPWRERNTTAVTYLFMGDELNLLERDRTVDRYEAAYLRPAAGSFVGVTGAGPARLTQFEILED